MDRDGGIRVGGPVTADGAGCLLRCSFRYAINAKNIYRNNALFLHQFQIDLTFWAVELSVESFWTSRLVLGNARSFHTIFGVYWVSRIIRKTCKN